MVVKTGITTQRGGGYLLVVVKTGITTQWGGGYLLTASRIRITRRWVPPRRAARTPPRCVEKRKMALRGGGYLLVTPKTGIMTQRGGVRVHLLAVLKNGAARRWVPPRSVVDSCPSCLFCCLCPVVAGACDCCRSVVHGNETMRGYWPSSPLLVLLLVWCGQ